MAPSSPRLPESCTWSLQWPALGAISDARINASTWLPGPFGLDWGWAGPGASQGGVPGMPSHLPLSRATPCDPHGVKM